MQCICCCFCCCCLFFLYYLWFELPPPSPPLQLFVVLLFQSKFPYLNHTVCVFFLTVLNYDDNTYEYSVHFNKMQSLFTLFVLPFFKTVILCLLPNIVTLHSPPPVSLLFRCCLIICDLITIILKIYTFTLCSVVN